VVVTSLSLARHWNEGNQAEAIEFLDQQENKGALVDVLQITHNGISAMNLDAQEAILGSLAGLVSSSFEEYFPPLCFGWVAVADSEINFLSYILTSCYSLKSVMKNLIVSDDAERHAVQVKNLREGLDELKRKPGKLGVTVRDTLKEISAIN